MKTIITNFLCIALLSIGLSSCTKSSSLPKSTTPTKATVTSVALADFSSSYQNVKLYAVVYDPNGTLIEDFIAGPYFNVTNSPLTFWWNFPSSFTVTNFSSVYTVRVFQVNKNGADIFIGGYVFDMNEFGKQGYPSMGTLYLASSGLKIQVLLTWQ